MFGAADRQHRGGWGPLRTAVMSDPALQRTLARIEAADEFATALVRAAATRGLAIARADVVAQLAPDPLGIDQWRLRPADGSGPPGESWLPAQVFPGADGAHLQWLYFGDKRLTEPFFVHSIRRVERLPFNRLFRYRQPLCEFLAKPRHAPVPDGFIFHMSRCGSTLVSQMLAARPDAYVVSEAPALDAILRRCRTRSEDDVRALRTIVAALGPRQKTKAAYVVKLDAWHTSALPLFRRAFPAVPWVFLYRDPVEVLVSQMRERGIQTVPGYLPGEPDGLDASVGDDEDCARALAAFCRPVVDRSEREGGLLVDYRQLPRAVETLICPHFGLRVAAKERASMREAARMDAKAPGQPFVSDRAEKQERATRRVRELAERHLDAVYRSLERLRRGSTFNRVNGTRPHRTDDDSVTTGEVLRS